MPSVVRRTAVRSSRPFRSTHTAPGTVDHDVGDRRIGEQRIERAEAVDPGHDPLDHRLDVGGGQQRVDLAHQGADVGGLDGTRTCRLRQQPTVHGNVERLGLGRAGRPVVDDSDRAHAAYLNARSRPRGSRVPKTPASTARATAGSMAISARTGAPTTCSTSARAQRTARLGEQHHARRPERRRGGPPQARGSTPS